VDDKVADREFAFEIRDAFELGAGFPVGATLVGPLVSVSTALAVGDMLDVPTTTEGMSRLVTCVQFPLVNLGPDRLDWVRVTVSGIRSHEVRVGGRAVRASE